MRTPPSDAPIRVSAQDVAEAVELAVVEYAPALANGTPPESVARTIAYAVGQGLRASHAVEVTEAAELVRMSDVVPEHVEWLWPARIPRGRLTVLDGDPGLGKSAVSLDLAARVTRGDRMPDGALGLAGPAGVVLLAAEDGLADTVRPRLDAAGADVERVVVLRGVRVYDDDGDARTRLPTVQDVEALEEAIRAVGAALLIVDPLVAYLGAGVDSYRDQDVRAGLAGLAELAERTGVAVLAIRHLRKSTGSNPIHAGGGSIGIIAAARSGLLVAPDPDDPESDRRVLATTKCNLARRPPSLAWRVHPGRDGVLRVAWGGESSHDASALLERKDPEDRTDRDEAAAILLEELREGPRPVADLRWISAHLEVSWRTVRRAADTLGIEKTKEGWADGWVWALPSARIGQPVPFRGRREQEANCGAGPSEGDTPPVPFGDALTAHAIDGGPQSEGDTMSATMGGGPPAHRCTDCGQPIGPTVRRCARCAYGSAP